MKKKTQREINIDLVNLNSFVFQIDLFCCELATTKSYQGDTPTFTDNKGEPWVPVYAMNGSDGFQLRKWY